MACHSRRRLLAVQSHLLLHQPVVRSEVGGTGSSEGLHGGPWLTPEEVQSFHDLGYLALPGLLTEEH